MAPTNTSLTEEQQEAVKAKLDELWDANEAELKNRKSLPNVDLATIQAIYTAAVTDITDEQILKDMEDRRGAYNQSVKDIIDRTDGRDDKDLEKQVQDQAEALQESLTRQLEQQIALEAEMLTAGTAGKTQGGGNQARDTTPAEDITTASASAPAAEAPTNRPEAPAIDQAIIIPEGYWTIDGKKEKQKNRDRERNDFTFENIEQLLNDPAILNRRQLVTVLDENGNQAQEAITAVTVSDVYQLLESDSKLISTIGQGTGGEQRLAAAERMVELLDEASLKAWNTMEMDALQALDGKVGQDIRIPTGEEIKAEAQKKFKEETNSDYDEASASEAEKEQYKEILQEVELDLTRDLRLKILEGYKINGSEPGLTNFVNQHLSPEEIMATRVMTETPELRDQAQEGDLDNYLQEDMVRNAIVLEDNVHNLQPQVKQAFNDMTIAEILVEADNPNGLDPNGPVTSHLLEAGFTPDRIREFYTDLEQQVDDIKEASRETGTHKEIDISGLRFGDAADVGLLVNNYYESGTLAENAEVALKASYEKLVEGMQAESIERTLGNTHFQGVGPDLIDKGSPQTFLAEHYIPAELEHFEATYEPKEVEWTKENYMAYLDKENGSVVSLEEIAKITQDMTLKEVKEAIEKGELGNAITELTKGTQDVAIRQDMVRLLGEKITDENKGNTLQQAIDDDLFTDKELASVRQEKPIEVNDKITRDDVKAMRKGEMEITEMADLTGEQMTWVLSYAKEGEASPVIRGLTEDKRAEFDALFEDDRAQKQLADVKMKGDDYKEFRDDNKGVNKKSYSDMRLDQEFQAMINADINIEQLYKQADCPMPTRTDGSVMELNELPMASYSGDIYDLRYSDVVTDLTGRNTAVDASISAEHLISRAQTDFGITFDFNDGLSPEQQAAQLVKELEAAAKRGNPSPNARDAYDVYRAIAYEAAVERFNEEHTIGRDAGPKVYEIATATPDRAAQPEVEETQAVDDPAAEEEAEVTAPAVTPLAGEAERVDDVFIEDQFGSVDAAGNSDDARIQQIDQAIATDLGGKLVQEKEQKKSSISATFDLIDHKEFASIKNRNQTVGLGDMLSPAAAEDFVLLLNQVADNNITLADFQAKEGEYKVTNKVEKAIKLWQSSLGLVNDGLFGNRSLAAAEYEDMKVALEGALEDGTITADEAEHLKKQIKDVEKAVKMAGSSQDTDGKELMYNAGRSGKQEGIFDAEDQMALSNAIAALGDSKVSSEAVDEIKSALTSINDEIRHCGGFGPAD